MFYIALISSHHCSNDSNNTKFITVDICSNYGSLLILVRRSPVTPMAFNVLTTFVIYIHNYVL